MTEQTPTFPRESKIYQAIAAQVITHKTYQGHFWFDPEQKLFQGSLRIDNDCICYEGATYDELVKDFINAIEDYLLEY